VLVDTYTYMQSVLEESSHQQKDRLPLFL